MSKLTPKQEMFCREYLVDLNGTQAAIRAGYAKRSAGQIAGENMKKPEIVEKIKELMGERAESVTFTAQQLLDDMVGVLAVAREHALSGDPRALTAYKGLADSVGKHQGVGAFIEKHDHTSSDGSMTPTAIERVIVYPEGE